MFWTPAGPQPDTSRTPAGLQTEAVALLRTLQDVKTPTDPKLPCDHLFKRAVDKALERPIVTGSDEFRSYIEWFLGPTHVEVSCDFLL